MARWYIKWQFSCADTDTDPTTAQKAAAAIIVVGCFNDMGPPAILSCIWVNIGRWRIDICNYLYPPLRNIGGQVGALPPLWPRRCRAGQKHPRFSCHAGTRAEVGLTANRLVHIGIKDPYEAMHIEGPR